MAFSLNRVIPWGRSLAEYRAMFRLSAKDLMGRLLGCGDGPASFNAEATKELAADIVSVDPIYRFSHSEIQRRIVAVYPEMIEQTRQNQAAFLWKHFASVEELGYARLVAMKQFLEDYEPGRRSGRYLAAKLPTLPFDNHAFDLALCSHLLFLYTDQLSQELHIASVRELCRVAAEVRIFPLLDLAGDRSRHMRPAAETLRRDGFDVQIEKVDYEFQRGADQMMRIRRNTSKRRP